MKLLINWTLRALCLLAFGAAAAKLLGLLPEDLFTRAPFVAAVLLLLHLLELVFVMKHVRLYQGPLAVSVLLSLLFGVLHWKPLADAEASRRNAGLQA